MFSFSILCVYFNSCFFVGVGLIVCDDCFSNVMFSVFLSCFSCIEMVDCVRCSVVVVWVILLILVIVIKDFRVVKFRFCVIL